MRRGEYVREGMVIGRADGALSANVHSSIPGVVRDIRIADLPGRRSGRGRGSGARRLFRPPRAQGRALSVEEHGPQRDTHEPSRDRGVVDTEAPGIPLFDLLSDQTRRRPPRDQRRRVRALSPGRDPPPPGQRRGGNGRPCDFPGILSPRGPSWRRTVVTPFAPDPSDEVGPVEWSVLEARYPQDMPRQLLEAIGEPEPAGREAIILNRQRPSPSTRRSSGEAHGRALRLRRRGRAQAAYGA